MELILEVTTSPPRMQVYTIIQPLVGHDLIRWHVLAPLGLVAYEEVEPRLGLTEAYGRNCVGAVEGG